MLDFDQDVSDMFDWVGRADVLPLAVYHFCYAFQLEHPGPRTNARLLGYLGPAIDNKDPVERRVIDVLRRALRDNHTNSLPAIREMQKIGERVAVSYGLHEGYLSCHTQNSSVVYSKRICTLYALRRHVNSTHWQWLFNFKHWKWFSRVNRLVPYDTYLGSHGAEKILIGMLLESEFRRLDAEEAERTSNNR